MILILAELSIHSLNNSVIKLKQKDIVVTNDAGPIAVDTDVTVFEETLSTINADLLLIESQKQEFTPISEIEQIYRLLNTLELRLHNFQQVLPRLNSRRNLIKFGGTILKSLYVKATISDINSLHETLSNLQSSTSDIVHSLSNQITYVKKLDTATRLNNFAVANLSNIVKIDIIQARNRFQQITTDILWLNVTLFNHSVQLVTIRQQEFALMKMIEQTDELLAAIQCVILGKLPINLINTTTSQNILRNVFL